MPEEKRKLNAWIPVSLYSKLENAGYDNITQALIKALEKFFEDPQEDLTGHTQDIEGYKQDIEILTAENTQLKEDIAGYQKDIEGSKKDLERIRSGYNQDITGYKENIKSLNREIERLKSVIQEAPDPLELVRLQERNEGLNLVIAEKEKRIEEKEKRIEDLNRDVAMLNGFAHHFKSVEVKQIEAPASEKKSFLSRLKFW